MIEDMSQYRKDRYARHKQIVEEWAVGAGQGKCQKCGSQDKLHWHHIDPSTKKRSIALMYSQSLNSIFKELEKCERLCKSCHEQHHKDDPALKTCRKCGASDWKPMGKSRRCAPCHRKASRRSYYKKKHI